MEIIQNADFVVISKRQFGSCQQWLVECLGRRVTVSTTAIRREFMVVYNSSTPDYGGVANGWSAQQRVPVSGCDPRQCNTRCQIIQISSIFVLRLTTHCVFMVVLITLLYYNLQHIEVDVNSWIFILRKNEWKVLSREFTTFHSTIINVTRFLDFSKQYIYIHHHGTRAA